MTKKAKLSNSQQALVDALAVVLADIYVLTVKTHGCHWNVTGMNFQSLHTLFEQQYNQLFQASDIMAERIRALGALAPVSMAQMLSLTKIKESSNKPLSAKDMIEDLIAAHEVAVDNIRVAIELADNIDDEVSETLLVDRCDEHEKTLWMLRSHLG